MCMYNQGWTHLLCKVAALRLQIDRIAQVLEPVDFVYSLSQDFVAVVNITEVGTCQVLLLELLDCFFPGPSMSRLVVTFYV